MSVSEFIVERQAELGVANRDLAEAAGYHNQNVITMIRRGKTKLPLDKVEPFARVLRVDSAWLFRLAMSEYMPETLRMIEQCCGPMTTNNERCMLEVWRHANNQADPEVGDDIRKGFEYIVRFGRGGKPL
ncbi:helix-turn-helix transcriptional regulator [Halomonas sp. 3H]|uniref:helix-turn-helix domain-containing protein n=1 Tax=Halomonas sp. 3H TaxID=2952527 RepID=UPI0020B8DDFE|nr:helix-turn-helix transcriptional regulator [Halomonas sp. 3H]